MILNEPAGQIARIVVKHVVQGVVKAWDDTSVNPHQMVEQFLDVLHHPSFQTGNPIQREMFDYMRSWIDSEDKNYTLNALTKEAVRNHKNHRKGHATEDVHGSGGHASFLPTPASLQHQATNYVHQQAQHIPGYAQYNQMFPTGPRRDIDDRGDPVFASSHQPSFGGYPGASSTPVQPAYASHSEPAHHYQQPAQSPYPGQYPGEHHGQPAPHYSQGGGYPGAGGPPHGHHPPPHEGFGGPPPAPGGFGVPPPSGWGAPPPGNEGWNAHPPHGGHADGGYPGAQYQQSHQGGQHQGGYPGSNWSAGQAPPSGRW